MVFVTLKQGFKLMRQYERINLDDCDYKDRLCIIEQLTLEEKFGD